MSERWFRAWHMKASASSSPLAIVAFAGLYIIVAGMMMLANGLALDDREWPWMWYWVLWVAMFFPATICGMLGIAMSTLAPRVLRIVWLGALATILAVMEACYLVNVRFATVGVTVLTLSFGILATFKVTDSM